MNLLRYLQMFLRKSSKERSHPIHLQTSPSLPENFYVTSRNCDLSSV